ncbi:hypothetical protein ABZ816_20130 [Actinosynnema sp. NPDC047251]|uniref:Putative membrane protein n=1 Tax=Saccharothrix espanaensis (strain ATCC 51144 / DSM 44229 / JCM 9112 / NBRC 15066 / NRRL 15764) TaxID=1179773 RepID=K0KEA2_SACES|nr:hypothetical protein [Saccharothrix espanaensis]CCH34873.1 putative membrane protein [Saccharothrix espanaensis DSM 44229]
MTATTTPTPVRDRVGWGDLAWLAWRQHRWQYLALGALAVLGSLTALVMAVIVRSSGSTAHVFPLVDISFSGATQFFALAPIAAGGLIGVFWAAPLLAVEYEQKTYVVAWGQDLTPSRWLLGKVVLLGVPAVGLSAGFGAAVTTLLRAMNEEAGGRFGLASGHLPFQPFATQPFEAVPLVQAGYAAFGFALGLALSAVTRRTLVAMAGTLGIFVVVRSLVGGLWRRYYWPAERVFQPLDTRNVDTDATVGLLNGTMAVDNGYADAAGNEVAFPWACTNGYDQPDGYYKCLADRGVVQYFHDYHPVDRLVPFQLVEFTIFVLLAAGLVALAFKWVRRSHGA